MTDPTPESSENDAPPAQVTVSTGFAERVGPDGVRRWTELIQEVADSAHGANTDEIAEMLQARLDADGLAGPPVEIKRLGEAIASHPGGGIAFVYDGGEHIGGPHAQPTGSAHQDTESDDRPLYS
ncbi:hypothetical protein [Allobranchiibius sp. GilTou38]|uniref:hypothetical protein n=1 Tax=Allobranchiibius sp. GilTou38 TaxID=2815210 RepID=UPI001AA0CCF7|nr:hypothetical protein [Allobranchiibius sp. GilTou38]MBO1768297.1 hypothetical protein [Allobranchiibius sp. GilTou38]